MKENRKVIAYLYKKGGHGAKFPVYEDEYDKYKDVLEKQKMEEYKQKKQSNNILIEKQKEEERIEKWLKDNDTTRKEYNELQKEFKNWDKESKKIKEQKRREELITNGLTEKEIDNGYTMPFQDKAERIQREKVKDFVEKKRSNAMIEYNTSNKILTNEQLSNMTWEEVAKANTDHYIKNSIYDFSGKKYKYEEGWRDNGGAGVIHQKELDKLIKKEEWEKAKKKKY